MPAKKVFHKNSIKFVFEIRHYWDQNCKTTGITSKRQCCIVETALFNFWFCCYCVDEIDSCNQ